MQLAELTSGMTRSIGTSTSRPRLNLVNDSMTESEQARHLRWMVPANVDLSDEAIKRARKENFERDAIQTAKVAQDAINSVKNWTRDCDEKSYDAARSAQKTWAENFKNAYGFDPISDEDSSPSVPKIFQDVPRKVIEEARRECTEVENTGHGFWLTACPGAGKTAIATHLLKAWRGDGWEGEFVTEAKYLDAARAEYDGVAPRGSAEERYGKAPLLVLDDVGATAPTKWGIGKLMDLVDYRYLKGLPIVMTSQFGADALRGRMSADPENGAALVSRLRGMCEIVKLPDVDHRRQRA